MVICIAPLTEVYSEALSACQAGEKIFKLRSDAGDIPCSITLRSARGVSYQSAGPTTDKDVLDQGNKKRSHMLAITKSYSFKQDWSIRDSC